jgi:uncharacterized protein (DUF58 family)
MLRGIGFVVLAALVIPAFGVLSVLVAVMLTALVAGFLLRPRIRLSGRLPERIVAGRTAHLTYRLTNVGRLPAYSLRVRFRALPETVEQTTAAHVVSRLGPGESTEVTVAIQPKRRGIYRIAQPVCESGFPFNLFRFGLFEDQQETLVVLPAFSLLPLSLAHLSRHVDRSSVRPAGRAGTSPEYVGSRPFRPGDSPRRIDVRAWARLSVPATKEYDDDLDNYAALVLDTRVPENRSRSKAKESEEFEAAVSLCASVAYTIHRDCLIDLLLAGADVHLFTSSSRAARLARIHETLAGVEASEGYQPEQSDPLLEDRLREISEAVFILLRWDETSRQLVELADRAGCHCTVMVVGEPDRWPTDDETSWAGDIRFVPAEGILTGRVDYL